jgi:hypothetical protein
MNNMNTTNGEPRQRNLTTADLAATANSPSTSSSDLAEMEAKSDGMQTRNEETQLAPLFTDQAAKAFRSRWDDVQRGFVDDPKEAVRHGDELVAQVIKSLAESFSDQRSVLEGELNNTDQSSTENLRLALRRYRSFFERLLAI